MYKKINIYINGVYVCSTNQARTCKEARERVESFRGRCLMVAGRGAFYISEGAKITAKFDKK